MTGMNLDDDQGSRMLASLPAYEPDRQCTEQIRQRCHAAVLGRRREAEVRPFHSWRPVFEFASIAALCAVYLAEVARHALVLYGF